MPTYNPTSIITLDSYKYAVMQGQYARTWTRFFSVQAQAGLVTSTFIDRGPGINKYTISLLITTWATTDAVYVLGVTQTWDVQKANLEASYAKIAKSLQFLDPFGVAPSTSGTTNGIYITQFSETVLDWSSPTTPYVKVDLELTEAVGIVISS